MTGSGSIIRVEHDRDRPYVIVSKELSENAKLSFALRGMLVYLLGKRSDWTTYMSQVEASGKEGREAIKALFVEGRAHGYIKTVERREKGRLAYEHTIYETPLATPIPGIVSADGGASSVSKRQQKAAAKTAKPTVNGKPSTGSRQRSAVNGSPSPESRSLISNDGLSNEEVSKKDLAADAAGEPGAPEQTTPEPQNTPTSDQDSTQAGGETGRESEVKALDTVPGAAPAAGEPDEDAARKAAYQEAYGYLWAQFGNLKARGLEGLLGARVNDALDLGHTPADLRAALEWATSEENEWERKRLTPTSFPQMLIRWQTARQAADEARARRRGETPTRTEPTTLPEAPQPTTGRSRRFL